VERISTPPHFNKSRVTLGVSLPNECFPALDLPNDPKIADRSTLLRFL
jgi:hypothetical protein